MIPAKPASSNPLPARLTSGGGRRRAGASNPRAGASGSPAPTGEDRAQDPERSPVRKRRERPGADTKTATSSPRSPFRLLHLHRRYVW